MSMMLGASVYAVVQGHTESTSLGFAYVYIRFLTGTMNDRLRKSFLAGGQVGQGGGMPSDFSFIGCIAVWCVGYQSSMMIWWSG